MQGGDPNVGRVIGGRYRIVEPVARGAMGVVYRAVHTHMGKDFAVKLLRPEVPLTEEAMIRFENEAAAATRLSHPSCVRVSDFGRTEDGGMYLVMEYLVGQSLARLLASEGRLVATRVVHIAAQMLDGIAHAHGLGIVHRDLKPENVMLVSVDGDPDVVKILDFGIARILVDDETNPGRLLASPAAEISTPGLFRRPRRRSEAGTVFGTPEYLSPEQALGEPADARADLYAIGVMMYELLAGRRPFDGKTPREILSAHLTREPRALAEVAPEARVGPALEAVLVTALRKRKGERWQTAALFLDALLAVPVDDVGASASPPPALPDGQQRWWSRAHLVATVRRRPKLVAGAGVFLALVVLAAVSTATPGVLGGAASADDLARVRTLVSEGKLTRARHGAEVLARRHPEDARVFALVGDTFFRGPNADLGRALAAYRAAVRLDRTVATESSSLVENVRALEGDRRHGPAARALATELGLVVKQPSPPKRSP